MQKSLKKIKVIKTNKAHTEGACKRHI